MAESQTDSGEAQTTDNYVVRCPTCGHKKTGLSSKVAHKLQKQGCPNCRDSRGLGVSEA